VPFTGSVDLCRRALLNRFCVEQAVTTIARPVALIPRAIPRQSHRRCPAETPLYETLAAEWAAVARMVPGDRDHEWADLVTRKIW